MDITNHIAPKNGIKYVLGGLGVEHCQSVLAPDGGIDFRKNRHYEALRINGDFIDRGEDTSMISNDGIHPFGTYYVLKHWEGSKLVYGSHWIKRDMRIGESFHRDALVVIYNYTGKELIRYPDSTNIRLVDHHEWYEFRSGIIVADVIELQWGGEEHYFYAKNYGLVGWRNLRTGLGSYITSYNANIQEPFRVPVIRPVQMTIDIPVYFTVDMLKFMKALHEI